MSTTMQRTPKSGRQSLFFNDLATPVSSRKGKFSTPGQAAAVSALWRENFASSDLPPPPVFTLEDRSDFSPESGILDYPMSPDSKSDPRTPVQGSGREFSTPIKNKSDASTSNALSAIQQSQLGSSSLNWWSPGKSISDQEEKGKGSPVEGVVQPGALMTLPPPREVARPEMQRSSIPAGNFNEEEWVTVYGFPPGDTNLVLREFEKCGVILKHIPGPRNANWVHILYQSRADAQRALSKNGMQVNGVLIVGVKPVDPIQRQVLSERASNQGFMTLPPASSTLDSEQNSSRTTARPYYLQNGTATARQSGAIASSTPYPNPSSGYYHQYHHHPPAGYYVPPPPPPPPAAMPMPLPAPYDHHHQAPNWAAAGRYPVVGPPVMGPPAPYVEHQKAVTIRNDVNLKKETLRVEPDDENPGKFLVTFTFDATVAGSITLIFFAKEGEDCKLTPTKETLLPPITVHFEQGLGQKFKQPSGTGLDFSMFEESDLLKEDNVDVYPLAVKADACPINQTETASDGSPVPGITNSQITQALFEKDKGEYKVKVLKQILWVNGMRYELQEIYGIGNSVEGEFEGNDPGKECVICLSEPRDTTVLPCRHMCMCSGCAKVLRFQTNRCPICRQPVERLLEIKVNNGEEEEKKS